MQVAVWKATTIVLQRVPIQRLGTGMPSCSKTLWNLVCPSAKNLPCMVVLGKKGKAESCE